jgi:hypothetical protein
VNTFCGERDMIWYFSRGLERIRIEDEYDKQTAEFVLHIDHPGGHRETKRFAEARLFRSWLRAFEDQLVARHWMPAQVLVEEAVPMGPASSQALPPSSNGCTKCGSARTRIVGQSGWPPLIHRRCEDCGHVSSRRLDD